MEARTFERFDPESPIFGHFELANEVTGEFLNREQFQIKDISMGGMNVMSNYPPLIGNSYTVLIHYGGEKHPFTVMIAHSRIVRFQARPEGVFKPGAVYSSGCRIQFAEEWQKKLVLGIIQNDCGIPVISGMDSDVSVLAAEL